MKTPDVIELENFKNSKGLDEYRAAKKGLIKSGVINLLRIFARPFTPDKWANPYTAAGLAAFTEGYNKALDDIVYFEEMFIEKPVASAKPIRANFGALGIALAKGDLKPEDIKNGKH